MPPSHVMSVQAQPEPVELSLEDAMLNTWLEDTSDYLRLDALDVIRLEAPLPDQA